MDTDILEKIGLNKSEAKVYLELLKIGSCKAGRIAKETSFHRTTVYKALETLIKKDLVGSVVKENRKYFEAGNPINIIKELDKQENEISNKKKEIASILPDLDVLFNQNKEQLEATIFRGIKGLKTIFNEIQETLLKEDEFIVFGAPEAAESFFGYFNEFNKKLHKKNIHYKIIFDERAKENIKSCRKYQHQVKTLSKEYMSPAEINIYKNNVAIVLWDKEPLAILIRGEKIAQSFKQYFNLLWKIAKK